MNDIKRIAVFCGSNDGAKSLYAEMAYQLGQQLALESIELVYGGARVGLMGQVANGALANEGKVTGVIPRFLSAKEIVHTDLT